MPYTKFGLEKFIPKVNAQSLDANVQPTFGILNIGDNVSATSSISLTADSTSVQVGKTFEVDIKIDTKGVKISEFEVIIDFDPNRLTVLDSEPAVSGTQIEFLDNIYNVKSGGNNVSLSSGRITLKAATPSSIGYEIVNRSVARIKFQSQATGSTVIEMVGGSAGSKLINERGTAIATIINDITISSTNNPVTDTGDNGNVVNPGGNNQNTDGNTDQGNQGTTGGVNTIPDTGLEDIAGGLPLLIGLFLIVIGLKLRNSRSRKHEA